MYYGYSKDNKSIYLLTIIIVGVMIAIGFLVNSKVREHDDAVNIRYEQAIKIEGSKEQFEYAMKTDSGDAFVYGTLKAVDPVNDDEIEGEYAEILKVKEEYRPHTVYETDSKGKTHTRTEWRWDEVSRETTHCNEIEFMDHIFEYGTIPFPDKDYIETVNTGFNTRYKYYGTDIEYTGAFFGELRNGTIEGAKTFVPDKTASETCEYMHIHTSGFLFWLFWGVFIIIILAIVYKFIGLY